MSPAEELSGSCMFSRAFEAATSAKTRQKPFLDRLGALYARMDHRYSKIAESCGFNCRGCEDSCCRTTFYHHTLVEYLYLRAGVCIQEKERQAKILNLSREVLANPGDGPFCPLNEKGRCLLYAYRPMICRLHGIAHQLRRPDGTVLRGQGCAMFEAVCKGGHRVVLDRTDFYWELSKLEQEARTAFGFSQKIKATISEMVTMMLQVSPEGKSLP